MVGISVERVRSRKRFARAAIGATVLGAAAVVAAATALTIVFDNPVVTCGIDGGAVSAGYTITTTAADAATVTETLRDSNADIVTSGSHSIAAGNAANGGGWLFAGRTKTYDGTFTASGLADGTYSLEICATQAGSQGNPGKSACLTETVVISCVVENAECTAAPFGEVVGNTNIQSNATAQINVRGDFGTEATVSITGPNLFEKTATVTQNGNSCNYHANWKFNNDNGADVAGNGGPGTYTITVTGNGNSLTFSVDLY